MQFDWPYYTLRSDGLLLNEEGFTPFIKATYSVPAQPRFETVWQAEDWLQTYDLRGAVQEEVL